MADLRLSDLQATASVSSTGDDILHLRTAGGLDKKITQPNLIQGIISYTEIASNDTAVENASVLNKVQVYKNTHASNTVVLTLGTSGKTISILAGGTVFVLYNGSTFYQLTSQASVDLSTGDSKIVFASDASILWDESEDEFNFNKQLYVLTIAKNSVASGTLIASEDSVDNTTSTSYITVATSTMRTKGTMRLYLQHKVNGASFAAYARLLLNGGVLIEWSTTSQSYVTRQYDATVSPGDVITWQHRAGHIARPSDIRYKRVYGDIPIDSLVIGSDIVVI